MVNIKSFSVILLHWVCLISGMCVSVRVLWGDAGPVVPPSHHNYFFFFSLTLTLSLTAEIHDGDDRIPRLPAQTWTNRSRIRGESWALLRLFILTHTKLLFNPNINLVAGCSAVKYAIKRWKLQKRDLFWKFCFHERSLNFKKQSAFAEIFLSIFAQE